MAKKGKSPRARPIKNRLFLSGRNFRKDLSLDRVSNPTARIHRAGELFAKGGKTGP